MKVTSGSGKGSGKLGSDVYYVSHGVQLKRDYTSEVSNPNTVRQVAQRLRFKLASQVSAALEPVIVIPRKQLQSPRNLFVKKNMGFFYSDGSSAQVTFEALQITGGSTPLPPLILERTENGIKMYFTEEPASNISRVIYCIYNVVENNQLAYRTSVIVNERDTRDTFFEYRVGGVSGDLVVYAYGISDRSVKATSLYNNYEVSDAMQLATLFSNHALKVADYGFTMTRGVLLEAGDSTNPQPGTNQFALSLTTTYGLTINYSVGSTQHTGVQYAREFVNAGTAIVAEAVGSPEYDFLGWCKNGSQQPFATTNTISFNISENTSLFAWFRAKEVIPNAQTIGGLE